MESVVTLSGGDAGELLTLQRAAYVTEAQAHDDPNLPPLMQSHGELVGELTQPAVIAFGLRDDSQRLVAAVRVHLSSGEPHVAEVGRLVVAPDMQGQGLGSRLLELVEVRVPEWITDLRLFTGDRSLGNLRLYSRFGYRETHRSPTPGGYALVHLAKRVR
ncbi:GNAT family N-acetyltransferase [Rhodococcus hoagii]|nr:GNAT family N-acetyltransferase [Prescottella equi]MBM4570226.1 GNAT family N-acetyltransferase [Prescottella equi]MBM4570237.1 GNAT family N-acetyltransferase [Prescottella equi]MBM4574793.1 GNAT family N-acetyltransferase [Prescottella equi]MBM4653985.1 GNAT family N-acetyltransferase [Prescottella equi]